MAVREMWWEWKGDLAVGGIRWRYSVMQRVVGGDLIENSWGCR